MHGGRGRAAAPTPRGPVRDEDELVARQRAQRRRREAGAARPRTQQLERLRVIQEEAALGAGLNLSRRDLMLRGTGDIFGEAQKGMSSTTRGAVSVELYRTVLQRVARVPSAADPSAAMAAPP